MHFWLGAATLMESLAFGFWPWQETGNKYIILWK
jgi:hypothetical protein